ncbi:MAG: hypothetical protein H0W08_25105 [Acidobacteria bacterium]|nr:hypothetical protein [Acidobacteriota bacterium]
MNRPTHIATRSIVLLTLTPFALAVVQRVEPPAGGTQNHIRLVARLHLARAAATATTTAGDRVLIAGGMTGGGAGTRSYEVFDARNDHVAAVGEMGQARAGHSATLLPDRRVLILGGYNGEYLKSTEIFDPRSDRFVPAGTMREGRSGHTATLLHNGTVLVIGGVGRRGLDPGRRRPCGPRAGGALRGWCAKPC